jgi:hypothetical protein
MPGDVSPVATGVAGDSYDLSLVKLVDPGLACYHLLTETTPFDLTPEQKDLLKSLSEETGKPISALLAAALESLQALMHPEHANGEVASSQNSPPIQPTEDTRQPIWEKMIEASREIPDEELDRLPTDLAAQVDHYIYGTPKQ